MTTLEGAVVLVTGGQRGIGKAIVDDLLTRGAAKVYATARSPRPSTDPRVVPLPLEVTDQASIDALAAAAPDVTVLINNAGALPETASLLTATAADIRATMETNFFGPVFVARAFAPILAAAGQGSVLVDVHSVASWYAMGGIYSASKAALWSATNSLRVELAAADVHVIGVHMGYVDTGMAAHVEGPKMLPEELVAQVYDGVEAGAYEIVADGISAHAKAALSGPVEALYPELHAPKVETR